MWISQTLSQLCHTKGLDGLWDKVNNEISLLRDNKIPTKCHYSDVILAGSWRLKLWTMWLFFNILCGEHNKANLRDLIAATGLVISNWIQIVNFSARVTVKFDGWPCKAIGHLFYATSSSVHLFVPIGEFKLKLQSGNAQSGSNWMIFRAVRPWNLTDDLAKQ